MIKTTCDFCGAIFEGRVTRYNRRFCAPKCARLHYKSTHDTHEDDLGLCAGTIGTLHELQVSVDLLRRGWNVFRSISPACFCDLVAIKDQHVILVQVTKARRMKSGVVTFSRHKDQRFDILALSFASGEIEYRPGLPAV